MINILRTLRNAMEVKRQTSRSYQNAADSSHNIRWKRTFSQLATGEEDRLETLELIHDHMAESNEWLVIEDMMDSTSKPLDVELLFVEGIPEHEIREYTVINRGIQASEDVLGLYERIKEEYLVKYDKIHGTIQWLINQEKEHLKALKMIDIKVSRKS